MIAQLAASVRRHHLGWGRIVDLTSGGPMGFPGQVSYGAAKAAVENYTIERGDRAGERRRHRQRRVPTGYRHGLDHRGGPCASWTERRPCPHRRTGRGGRGDRLALHRRRPARHRQHRPPPVGTCPSVITGWRRSSSRMARRVGSADHVEGRIGQGDNLAGRARVGVSGPGTACGPARAPAGRWGGWWPGSCRG